MKFEELNNKKVQVYFKPSNSFYGLDDINIGRLTIKDDHYELHYSVHNLDLDELVSESCYRFDESQVDTIVEVMPIRPV